MRILLLFAYFFNVVSFSLELSVSEGMQDNSKYAVLNLFNNQPFVCQSQTDEFGNIKEVICSFDKFPKEDIKPVENEFFFILAKKHKENFFLIIKGKKNLYLRPIIFNLVKDDEVFPPQTDIAKRWVIVGYDKKLPFIKKEPKKDIAISFPFYYKYDPLPYVGGLDLQGNPVHIQNSEDVKAYVEVKKLFDKKKYDECIDNIDMILQRYPKTLFRSELLYYKIKSFFKLRSYDSVIDLSKEYLREYSASEDVPEILLLTAVAYYKNGAYSDADYFFDRLFNEHADSKYSKEGYIYKGDMASDSGEDKKAQKYYKKALMSTKDIDIATLAAFKLALLHLSKGEYDQAKKYIDKILQAKDSFFYAHYSQSKNVMLQFAESEHYLEAAKIDEALIKYMRKTEDDYESNLKNVGIWYSHTKQKKKAIQYLDRYIKEFPDGDYIIDVEKRRDSLFFDTNENTDDKALLKKYDQLIATYKDDPIGQKALYEKALLMLKKKMYSDILQIKEQIQALDPQTYPKKDEIIQEAILGLMENALQTKQCGLVLKIQEENNVSVDSKWDDGLYNCFIKAANYQKAKVIALRDMKTNDIAQKEKWLYRYAKVSFATGNYTEAISAAKDLLAMIDNIKTSPYKDIYRTLFDAYNRLGNYDGMLDAITKIEELFGLNYKDIDRFVAMINVGVAKKDDNIIIKYGQKLFDLQKRLHSYGQSPFVEFALYQAYMNKENYNKALEVISYIDDLKMKPENKARQRYLKGVVLDKLWQNDKAKQAYKEAIAADKNSAWASLAQSALELDQ